MATLSVFQSPVLRTVLDFYDNFIPLIKQRRYSGLDRLVEGLSILLILKLYLKTTSPKLNNSVNKEPFN